MNVTTDDLAKLREERRKKVEEESRAFEEDMKVFS